MPGTGKHSAKWDRCFTELQKQGKSKDSAAAICTATVKEATGQAGGARWFKEGETFLYVDPQTFKLEEVTRKEVPHGEKIFDIDAEVARLTEEARSDVTPADKKAAEKEYGNVEYADPENKKYPLDEKHVHAAWSYINMPKNAGKYSPEAASRIKSRISAAFKRITGHEPPSEAKESEIAGVTDLDALMEAFSTSQFPQGLQPGQKPIPQQPMQQAPQQQPPQNAPLPPKPPIAQPNADPQANPHQPPVQPQAGLNPGVAAVKHSHLHAHGTLVHEHDHEHDQEHGIDNLPPHDHLHAPADGQPTSTEQEPDKGDKQEPKEGEPKEQPTEPAQEPTGGEPETPEAKKKKPPFAKESIRTVYLGELASLQESVADEAAKTLEVTLIKPGWSANGKYYSREALTKAISLFEGAKAFADHPSFDEEKNRPERSVLNITGYYTGVKQTDDGSLRATRHFVGKRGDEVYQLALEAIKNKPDLLGLSINALGKTKIGEVEGRKGVIVESIVKASSIDDVTTPAAGGKYEALRMGADEFTTDLLQNLEYDEWRESRPDFVARIQKEMRTARKDELDNAISQENATLRESAKTKDGEIEQQKGKIGELENTIAQLQKDLSDQRTQSELRESEHLATTKLAESKLPESWQSALKPQLVGKPASDIDALIESERKKYFSIKTPVNVQHVTEPSVAPTFDLKAQQVSEALGVDPAMNPREGESPEQWAKRVRKVRGN